MWILTQLTVFTQPAGCSCDLAQAGLRSPAAGTRSRWSEGSDKRSPSHCRPYDPAYSGDSCKSPGPNTPATQTQNSSSPFFQKDCEMTDCDFKFNTSSVFQIWSTNKKTQRNMNGSEPRLQSYQYLNVTKMCSSW